MRQLDVPVYNLAPSKTPQDDLRKRYRSLWNKGVSYIGLTFFSEPSYSVTALLEIHTKNWSFHDSLLTVQKVPWVVQLLLVDLQTSALRFIDYKVHLLMVKHSNQVIYELLRTWLDMRQGSDVSTFKFQRLLCKIEKYSPVFKPCILRGDVLNGQLQENKRRWFSCYFQRDL